MAINQLVVDEVKTHYPSIGVLGEEASHKVENLNDLLWVCDPIDGTIPYMLHITASTGCLALVQDGEPVVGVVYDYMSDRMFSAVKGGGALLNGKPFKPSGRPMKMVDIGVWPDSIFDISKLSRTLLAQRYQQPNFCSHAFACMLVAQRRIAGAVYPGSKPWDGAASKVILSELGVKMTDIHGSEQRFDGKLNGLIVGYPETHQLLVSSI